MNLLSKLKAKLPAWLWAGLTTAFFTFVGLFGASLLGWVQDVIAWASPAPGETVVFPSVSVLGKAAVSAAGAAVTGLLNAVYRYAQSKTSLIPGDGPVYPTK